MAAEHLPKAHAPNAAAAHDGGPAGIETAFLNTQVQLTPVEKTAVQVSVYRFHGAYALVHGSTSSGTSAHASQLLYDPSLDRAIMDAALGPEGVTAATSSLWAEDEKNKWGTAMMAVRTLALDDQLCGVVQTGSNPWDTAPPGTSSSNGSTATATGTGHTLGATSQASPRQVVILGAGLDTRAWRLQWPQATHVWEVDTGSVEVFKARALAARQLRCETRTPVVADLCVPRKLHGALARAGLDWSKPCVFVMEGLIGYLSPAQASRLLRRLHQASAPGSHLVLTCPPTPEVRQEMKQRGVALHHATFEAPEESLARVRASGWDAHLVSGEQLTAKYGLECWQGQIWATKSVPRPREPHVHVFLKCTIS